LELFFAGVFWFTVLLLVHTYILYPVTLAFFSLFKSKGKYIHNDPIPSVSILISAYNEEKVIRQRIDNIKSLKCDFNKLELIIGSDCSTDSTNEIIQQQSAKYNWIKVELFQTRRGKASVLNDIAGLAKNEILIFTDANSMFDEDAVSNLISRFSDDAVGGVCGRLVLEEPKGKYEKSNKERLYWKYETVLKKFEGILGILISANGGIFAIRKKLFTKFPMEYAVTDDLYQTLAVLSQNYNFVYEYNAVAREDISKEVITEFKRKVRFAATNFQTIKDFKNLLLNKKILMSYAIWSHKVLRWLVPVIAILLFISNLFLIKQGSLYYGAMILQICFYFAIFVGFIFHKMKISGWIFSIFYYYALTNVALLIGMFKFFAGKHAYTWDSTPR